MLTYVPKYDVGFFAIISDNITALEDTFFFAFFVG
jgi:hypothetical protein